MLTSGTALGNIIKHAGPIFIFGVCLCFLTIFLAKGNELIGILMAVVYTGILSRFGNKGG
jgi:hypothetical protein